MSTQKETTAYILETLESHSDSHRMGFTRPYTFAVRAMFGEYALYCGGKVVALICNDLLYVKIVPVSFLLEAVCDTDAPYDGAKLHYVVEEEQLRSIENLAEILQLISKALPKPKLKKKP